MCGIFGYISKQPNGLFARDMDMLETMALFNVVRGRDSTGLFCQKRNGDIIGAKTATHPLHLFVTDQWAEFRRDAIQSGKFVVGHGRAATRGSVKNANAHPFVENNIILVHNGTLHQTKNISDVSTEVDSHAIAHALTESSPQEVIEALDGAFALVWFNTETNKLYAVRNTERPLVILDSSEGYIICSEDWIGGIAASRQGRHITSVIQVKPGDLYSWDSSNRMSMSVETVKLRSPTWQEEYAGCGVYGSRYRPTSTTTKEAVRAEQEAGNSEGSDETPIEITRLRQALARQATKPTSTPSTSCVLTQESGTPETTSRGEMTTSGRSDEDLAEERTVSIRTEREDVRKGQPVLIKILAVNPGLSAAGRMKYTGKIRDAGTEMLDCIGFLPKTVSAMTAGKYVGSYFMGVVQFVNQTTNGGPSVMMGSDLFPVTMEQVHEEEVPSQILFHAIDHLKCDCCDREVKLWERKFLSVRMKGKIDAKTPTGGPLNVVEITCPDCTAAKMIKGSEYRKAFEEKYAKAKVDHTQSEASGCNPSLSNRKPVSSGASGKDGTIIELQSSKTVH